jgi:hypothetical protein
MAAEEWENRDNSFNFNFFLLLKKLKAVLRIRIHRIHMFLGILDPDPLVEGMDPDPDPDPSVIKQKK